MSISLNSIFQKNVDGTFTNNALLRYSLVISNHRSVEQIDECPNFTHRSLAKWLINNNHEFVTLYRGRDVEDSYKIENTQKRVKKMLKDFESLELIRYGKTKQEKGSADIPLYIYSQFGYVLAEIIESFDPNKREKANNELYRWFQIIYGIKESSASLRNAKRKDNLNILLVFSEKPSTLTYI